MALDFPNSPTIGQTFPNPPQAGIPVWSWDGSEWKPTAQASTAGALTPIIRLFTATGTYVPTTGMLFADVRVRGSGGGGGGINQGTFPEGGGAGGGGQGSFSQSLLSAAQIGASQPITIGPAGVGGAAGNNPGTAGSACSFGTLVIANPGAGGGGTDPVSAQGLGGAGGTVGTGQFCEPGFSGGAGAILAGAANWNPLSGFGGGPGGGASIGFGNGNNATGYGAGGGGGARTSGATTGQFAGGNASTGYVEVIEWGYFTAPSSIGIPSGTVMLFWQAAAPTGWTQVTTQNDKALRVVSGAGGVSGGTNAFSTVMAQTVVGNTTLTTAMLANHAHSIGSGAYQFFAYAPGGGAQYIGGTNGTVTPNTDANGSNNAHNHTITMAIQYIDIILASKN